MASSYVASIDVRAMISAFGGVTKLWAMMQEEGCELSLKAVEKWRERDAMPADAIASVITIAYRRKVDFKLSDYIRTTA